MIDEPANDRDVPADATVPVAVHGRRRFGIQSARLIYKVATGGSEPTQEVVLPLWDFTAGRTAPARPPVKHRRSTTPGTSPRSSSPPGSIITFHADARDFDNLKGPNLGKSRELRLRVVSDEDIAASSTTPRREHPRGDRARSSPCRSRPSPPSTRPSAPSRRPTGSPGRSATSSRTPR